jgi:hypothetical protein
MEQEITKPAELAAKTGWSYAEVNVSRARILRIMKSIVAAERDEDEEVTS